MSALGSTIARSSARLACALALAVGVGACAIGHKVSHPTTADSEQIYVDAGKVTYQVQITRALNPWSTEDREYLFGVPSSEINLQPDQLWFGVFLWAKDQTHQAVETTDKFTIVDSAGDVYHPIPLNPVTNPYAWNSEMLEPGDTEPVPGTTAALGPTQGGLILFKLNDSVYSNRPLTLNISAAGQAKPSTVSLDL